MEGRRPTKGNIEQQNAPRTQSRTSASQRRWSGYVKSARKDKRTRFTALLHHVTRRAAAGELLRAEARSGAGSGRRDVAASTETDLEDNSATCTAGCSGERTERSRPESLHPESRRAAAAARRRGAGRQDRPARRRRGAERDLRRGLPRLLVRVPAGAQPASMRWTRSGRAHAEEGELGARRGHPWVLRYHRPRLAGEVPRAPDRGPADSSAHPEMAERGRLGGRELVGDGGGTPQGAVVSPLLANVYLHYVFDLWVQHGGRRTATAT